MLKKNWMKLGVLLIIGGLLVTVSCAKKTVRSGIATELPKSEQTVRTAREAAPVDTSARDAEAARQKAMEEERIREQRIREQQMMEQRQREAAVSRDMEAARSQFMNDDIYFDFDKSTLKPAAQETLKKKAEFLQKNPNVSVTIEGHCDERGTTEYNLALGERRAESAKSFLVNLGISASRLNTISYGEERPVDKGRNEAAWAKNRRAHFVIN